MLEFRRTPERLRIRSRDRILFAKRLALYLRAGIPILGAIDLIRAAPGSSRHARLLSRVMSDIQAGIPLSRSLAVFRKAYSPMQIQLIAIGETSGTLPESLSALAGLLEERANRKRKAVGLLAYPFILLVGSLGMSVFLLLYAFPKIVPLFRGLHAQLPFTTRVLLCLSSSVQGYWPLLLMIGVMLASGGALLLRMKSIKKRLDTVVLRLPLIGSLVRAQVLSYVFRTFATLLSSGTHLDESIRLAGMGLSNTRYRSALHDIRRNILAGTRLSSALSAHAGLFPDISFQLISAGELTGTLAESASATAQIYEEESASRLQLLSAALEPIIMVSMGCVIGFIALAIISPMYSLTQNLTA